MPKLSKKLREFAEGLKIANLDCLENVRTTNGVVTYVKRTDLLDYSKEDHERFIYLYNKDGTLLMWEEDGEWMCGFIAPNEISLGDLERVRANDYRTYI
jgi:hypothetical protein